MIRTIRRKHDKKCVVFIVQCYKPRVAKIAYALTLKGYKVILLLDECSKQVGFAVNRNDKDKFFSKVYYFGNNEKLFRIAKKYSPLVYHIFSESYVPDYAEFIIKNKAEFGKIVFDIYDVYKDMAVYSNKIIENRERLCLENADGICCRSFETQHLKRKYNYKFKHRRLLFFDYCWGDLEHDEKVTPCNEDPNELLKIVYGGRIVSPILNNSIGLREWKAILFIDEICSSNRGKLVIIPTRSCGDYYYSCFKRLSKRSSSFELKEPMDAKELIAFEKGMDYGTDTFEFASDTPEGKQNGSQRVYAVKAKYSVTNKYFDYIDAGIPFIYGKRDEMFGKYLERFYACGIYVPLENLEEKFEYLRENRNKHRDKVIQARKELSIHNQINRLVKYYEEI